MNGAVVFVGKRIPVATLFENLKAGATVDEFLEWFPGSEKKTGRSSFRFCGWGGILVCSMKILGDHVFIDLIPLTWWDFDFSISA